MDAVVYYFGLIGGVKFPSAGAFPVRNIEPKLVVNFLNPLIYTTFS